MVTKMHLLLHFCLLITFPVLTDCDSDGVFCSASTRPFFSVSSLFGKSYDPRHNVMYCTISFNSAVPCPQLRWFGRNRFPVPCTPPMWPTPKCGLRNASKLVIFENPYSRVYFPTIRGLIVLDHSCTLIERNY